MHHSSFLLPDWPGPSHIRAYTTTRCGGQSVGAYSSFNLGAYVGDTEYNLHANRQYLLQQLALPTQPYWLQQVHGTTVCALHTLTDKSVIVADGSWTNEPKKICVVTTADCLPVLLCDQQGTCVAALHAGWRGLLRGILDAGIQVLPAKPHTLLAWLGPAISAKYYEVGAEVRQAFLQQSARAAVAFTPSGRRDHWYMDIYTLARQYLQAAGITAIFGGGYCTYGETDKFYSYRRDSVTGRMASLIWFE